MPATVIRRLTTSRCNPQKLYIAIKTHKPGCKIRPIVSNCGGPLERISWLLQRILAPLLDKVNAHLTNTSQLLSTLCDTPSDSLRNTIPISYDVISLYTNIPIDEAISTALEYISRHNIQLYGLSINDFDLLLSTILNNNTFTFNNVHYRQVQGLAMGSRIAPVLAIIVLDKLENMHIYNNPYTNLQVYKRYIDDIFTIMPNTQSEVVLNYLNNIHPTLKFEMELPKDDGFLYLLDTAVKINSDGDLYYKFFQKEAKKDIFINFNSSQPTSMKYNAIRAEYLRVQRNTSTEEFLAEGHKQLDRKFLTSGYSSNILQNQKRILTQRNTQHSSKTRRHMFYLPIPFVSDTVNNKIRQLMKKYNINGHISNKSHNTLGTALNKHRPNRICNKRQCVTSQTKLCFKIKVVYSIKCNICQCQYIGSTSQYFHDRVAQHLRSPSSSIYQHIQTCKLATFRYSILHTCTNIATMLITEGMAIREHQPSLNRRHECEDSLRYLYG